MLQSDKISNIVVALCKAHANIKHASKDSTNPHFKNDYASLESVIDATKKALLDQQIVVLQGVHDLEGRSMLCTQIIHTSGEWFKSYTPIFNEKNNAQGQGSGISYSRRYALAAMCNISQVDDDGNDAVAPKPTNPTKPNVAIPQERPVEVPMAKETRIDQVSAAKESIAKVKQVTSTAKSTMTPGMAKQFIKPKPVKEPDPVPWPDPDDQIPF